MSISPLVWFWAGIEWKKTGAPMGVKNGVWPPLALQINPLLV
jgi:hypothetical protein